MLEKMFSFILEGVDGLINIPPLSVALTVIVVSIMFIPFFIWQHKLMKISKIIQSEIDSLKIQYSEDKKVLYEKITEVYKKHNINPLTFFILIFSQLIIFRYLFKTINSSAITSNDYFFGQWNIATVDQTKLFPLLNVLSLLLTLIFNFYNNDNKFANLMMIFVAIGIFFVYSKFKVATNIMMMSLSFCTFLINFMIKKVVG